uniref:Uncharacterized protein n=1 Tax=Chromera velia CCMP2878 TaxID=1169474 RepID=A0A0G4GY37_9ALVE|eukprot:Cvel_23813.t1-p1 / transcript=Cvel_23813.t1 / gene=Cvel_23813 / organism=Chromera_velia_CCMP2878 / gene_product=hypothetical protein / transcript_product=hypothetical protein / location=Cvel_scaffold2501:9232-13868(+) / protein_length=1069 / sequence_SO=supercontig / SO=protein_coding / is_pseudo=false
MKPRSLEELPGFHELNTSSVHQQPRPSLQRRGQDEEVACFIQRAGPALLSPRSNANRVDDVSLRGLTQREEETSTLPPPHAQHQFRDRAKRAVGEPVRLASFMSGEQMFQSPHQHSSPSQVTSDHHHQQQQAALPQGLPALAGSFLSSVPAPTGAQANGYFGKPNAILLSIKRRHQSGPYVKQPPAEALTCTAVSFWKSMTTFNMNVNNMNRQTNNQWGIGTVKETDAGGRGSPQSESVSPEKLVKAIMNGNSPERNMGARVVPQTGDQIVSNKRETGPVQGPRESQRRPAVGDKWDAQYQGPRGPTASSSVSSASKPQPSQEDDGTSQVPSSKALPNPKQTSLPKQDTTQPVTQLSPSNDSSAAASPSTIPAGPEFLCVGSAAPERSHNVRKRCPAGRPPPPAASNTHTRFPKLSPRKSTLLNSHPWHLDTGSNDGDSVEELDLQMQNEAVRGLVIQPTPFAVRPPTQHSIGGEEREVAFPEDEQKKDEEVSQVVVYAPVGPRSSLHPPSPDLVGDSPQCSSPSSNYAGKIVAGTGASNVPAQSPQGTKPLTEQPIDEIQISCQEDSKATSLECPPGEKKPGSESIHQDGLSVPASGVTGASDDERTTAVPEACCDSSDPSDAGGVILIGVRRQKKKESEEGGGLNHSGSTRKLTEQGGTVEPQSPPPSHKTTAGVPTQQRHSKARGARLFRRRRMEGYFQSLRKLEAAVARESAPLQCPPEPPQCSSLVPATLRSLCSVDPERVARLPQKKHHEASASKRRAVPYSEGKKGPSSQSTVELSSSSTTAASSSLGGPAGTGGGSPSASGSGPVVAPAVSVGWPGSGASAVSLSVPSVHKAPGEALLARASDLLRKHDARDRETERERERQGDTQQVPVAGGRNESRITDHVMEDLVAVGTQTLTPAPVPSLPPLIPAVKSDASPAPPVGGAKEKGGAQQRGGSSFSLPSIMTTRFASNGQKEKEKEAEAPNHRGHHTKERDGSNIPREALPPLGQSPKDSRPRRKFRHQGGELQGRQRNLRYSADVLQSAGPPVMQAAFDRLELDQSAASLVHPDWQRKGAHLSVPLLL